MVKFILRSLLLTRQTMKIYGPHHGKTSMYQVPSKKSETKYVRVVV